MNNIPLEAAAALFIQARGRGGENTEDDRDALIKLMKMYSGERRNCYPGVPKTVPDFIKELTAFLPKAKIAPGIQVAWLPDKNVFYASVHIFPGDHISSRQVMAKATDIEYDACISKLYTIWKGIAQAVNPAFFEPQERI